MKKIMPLLGILILVSCFGSQGTKRYFQLQLPEKITSDLTQIPEVLFIESVVAEDLYDDFRVIYRSSPYQINYYPYDFWVKKPAVLLRNTMVQFFSELGFFRQVSDTLAHINPDIVLKSRLIAIEEVDSDSRRFARLSMELNFVDFKSLQPVYNYRFDREKEIPGKEISQLPRIISEILQQELGVLIQPLHHKIEAFSVNQPD